MEQNWQLRDWMKKYELPGGYRTRCPGYGDANRIIQIVTNLITNAITYSPENTTVSIRLKENETHGIIEIEDQGIGIEKHEIARVFERFYRVDRARSRNSGGTGLA